VTAATLTEVRTVPQLRAALDPARVAGATIAFVPTMGALHLGHVELVRRARAACDLVVVSCFVNPLQFGAGEDLEHYPRTPEHDARVVADAGADLLWRPTSEDVYGDAGAVAATRLDAGPLGGVLEGVARPGHFDGVVTVVSRLLDAVEPTLLVLGEKDFQQLAILRRLVGSRTDRIAVLAVPTVREPDGHARSSRNAYLSASERALAGALPRSIDAARAVVAAGSRDAREIIDAASAELDSVDVDYVAVVDPRTLEPLGRLGAAGAQLLLAARVGTKRLIDNAHLGVPTNEERP
jgi:pantoate--beta-alanine ligase